jgi:DNA adenine methylase
MWAGGKTKVLKHHSPFLPSSCQSYTEPFFGGGAMYLYVQENLRPEVCRINDTNEGIIRIYRSVKADLDSFLKELDPLCERFLALSKPDRKKFYYEVRHQHAYDFEGWTPTKEAATLYFLMKTGFNGVWQINKNTNNRYGTPSGLLKQTTSVYDLDCVKAWHDLLQNTEVSCGDYRDCPTSELNYLDPPYRVSTTSYSSGWGDNDLVNLMEWVKTVKGKVLLCNRDDGSGFFDRWSEDFISHTFPMSYTVGRSGATSSSEVLLVR